MTLARERHSRCALLRDYGVEAAAYRAILAGHHGDELLALHDVLAAIVGDPLKPPQLRRRAALQLVHLERDGQHRTEWQRTVHELELGELARRGVLEAAVVSANPDCIGCAAVNNALIDVANAQSVARLPPRACLQLQQGHSCCISFAPRIVAARVEVL